MVLIKYVFLGVVLVLLSAVIYKYRLELFFALFSLLLVLVYESVDLYSKLKVIK